MTDAPSPSRRTATVQALRTLSEATRLLRLSREGLAFEPGQEIMLHGPEHTMDRAYSIASGTGDHFVDIYFRLIPDGRMTPWLDSLRPGDPIDFTGPIGSFILKPSDRPVVFIATGTGLAPCISFIRSSPQREYHILHGVRLARDLWKPETSQNISYHPCVTREKGVGFHGRVTAYRETWNPPPNADYYLCGSNDMISEMRESLIRSGVPGADICTEPYYFW